MDETRSMHHGAWRRRPMVETDSYVIIPVGTPFHSLVQTALLRLGYSPENAAAAKVTRLWKSHLDIYNSHCSSLGTTTPCLISFV